MYMVNTPGPPIERVDDSRNLVFFKSGSFSHKFTTFSPTVLVVKKKPKFNSESP